MAEALYRKYRPQIFDDVVGQDGIEETLKAAIATGRLSHAYMFCGPRGTGKTTTARLVAKALLCEAEPQVRPDGTCEQCELIARGTHPDVYELDAASRTGVENVRDEIISRVAFAPMRGRYKIYIIDEVHMLSTAAFNALLKTLEEPPEHVVFIMCTTDPQKVPATIQSRCQRFDFKSIDAATIASRLAAICEVEGIQADSDALDAIAKHARGGMRDALTNLEQASTFGRGKVDAALVAELFGTTDSDKMDNLLAAILRTDMAECYGRIADISESGIDCGRFIQDFAVYLRGRYLSLLQGNPKGDIAGVPEPSGDFYAYALNEISQTMSDIKTSNNPSLDLELFCIRTTHPQTQDGILALAARVAQLESRLAQGAGLPASVESHVAPELNAGFASSLSTIQQGGEGAGITARATAVNHINAVNQVASQSVAQSAPQSDILAQSVPADSGQAIEPTVAPSAGAAHPPLAQAWALLLSDIKSQSSQLSMFLNPARPRFSSQTFTFVIKYAKRDKFYFDGIQSKASREVLTAALHRIYGRPVNLKFELVEDPNSASSAPAAAQPVRVAQPDSPSPDVAAASAYNDITSGFNTSEPQGFSTAVMDGASAFDEPPVDISFEPPLDNASLEDIPPFEVAQVPTDLDSGAQSVFAVPSSLSLNESKLESNSVDGDDSSWQADLQSAFSGQVRIREIDR